MKADEARPVRSGEELDLEALTRFLEGAGLNEGALSVEQFPGGYSNLTYLLRLGSRELVLRRPPRGSNVRGAHDMGREYRLLSALHPHYPRVPRPLAMCEDEAVLGSPFYVMERVKGLILRKAPPEGSGPELMRELSTGLIDLLADLHSLDYQAIGMSEMGKPDGYVGRQVSGWTDRWQKSRNLPVASLDEVVTWLSHHQPAESGAALIHNDFKYDNLVLSPQDPRQVLAVLDWEMATLGDPLMDLGTTLGYWIEADDPAELRALGFGPTFFSGNLTRAQLAERYAARRGIRLNNLPFYHAFGLFKIAVIAQQIYARFLRGLTTDPRFQHLDVAVRLLGERALHTARSA